MRGNGQYIGVQSGDSKQSRSDRKHNGGVSSGVNKDAKEGEKGARNVFEIPLTDLWMII